MRISDWSSDVCSSDLDALRTTLPDAEATRATVIGYGWDVVAWRLPAAGGDWTLRVPRHAEAIAAIEGQTCLADVPVRYELQSEERRGGNRWVIPGRSRGSPSH